MSEMNAMSDKEASSVEDTEARSAMKLALEALTATMSTHGFREHIEEAQDKAIKALEEALAKQKQGEPVAFLANGTRFKISYDSRQSGGQIHGIPPELGGRWVAFVAAEDDCHLKLTTTQQEPFTRQILDEWTKEYKKEVDYWKAKHDLLIKALKKNSVEPVEFITPLMESQMFDDWCPYKGNPDPRTVWAAAIEAVNGLLLGAKQEQRNVSEQLGEPMAWMYVLATNIKDGVYGGWENRLSRQKPNVPEGAVNHIVPLYTTPQQRTWVGLTTKDQKEIQRQSVYVEGAIRMTEARLKEKNSA